MAVGAGRAGGLGGCGAAFGLFDDLIEIGDEGLFEILRAATFDDSRGAVAHQHLAGVHERDAVAALRLVHEMGGDEDGHAVAAREIDQALPEGVARDGIDAGGRLVEDQDVGRMDHRHGERQALADAERQGVGQGAVDVGEVEARQHIGDTGRDPVGGHGEEAGVQVEVLPNRQLAVEREGLRHVADAAAHIHVLGVDRVAEEVRRALACLQKACQHLHRRGLAAAVGAEEAEDLALVDAEADVLHGGEIAEAFRQVARLDGDVAIAVARRDVDVHVTGALGLRQERDEGGIEIGGPGAFEQRLRRARRQNLAGIHRDQPVEAGGFLHVGGGDDHAHAGAAGADILDQFPELAARQRVDAGGGLVEDQQVRIVDERAAQPQLLLHAAGELSGRAVGEGGKARGLEQLADAALALGPGMAEEAAEELDVLEDRQRRVEVAAEALRHVGDGRAGLAAVAAVGHVAAEHEDLALLHGARARDQRQQGGLAHAIGPDEADHPAGGNVEVDRLQGLRLAIGVTDAGKPRDAGAPVLRRPFRFRHAHLTRFSSSHEGHTASGSM